MGDLHAGNIMLSDKGATVIDFGNCIRMSAAEQDKIRVLVSKASIGFGEDAVKTFRELLGEDARRKLDDILENRANKPHNEAFRKDLYGVFTKGTAADVMARIYAAMNLIQREGVEIPGTVANNVGRYYKPDSVAMNDLRNVLTTDRQTTLDTVVPFVEWLCEQRIPADDISLLREKRLSGNTYGGSHRNDIDFALSVIKDALGFGEDANLPPEIAKLAVAYLAQIDPRCALAVKSLTPQDYDRFLLSVGQDPDSALLRAAIDALRNAKGDAELQGARPAAVKEFNDVDAEADVIDMSWGKVAKIAKNIGSYFGGDDE